MKNQATRLGFETNKTPMNSDVCAIRHRGYTDASRGLPYPADYDRKMFPAEQLAYERGRHQWAIASAETGGKAPAWRRNERFHTALARAGCALRDSVLAQTSIRTGLYAARREA